MTGPDSAPISLVEPGLGTSSYLLDLGDGRAVVVDPTRDVSPYVAAADRLGWSSPIRSRRTYTPTSSLAVGSWLLERRPSSPQPAGIEWPHRAFGNGDEVDLGGLCLRALATPGHTPEHLSWLLLDGSRPLGLFSGGALLVGAVARTDLIAPDQTEPLARGSGTPCRRRSWPCRTRWPSTPPTAPARSARPCLAGSGPRRAVAALTAASGAVVAVRMYETHVTRDPVLIR